MSNCLKLVLGKVKRKRMERFLGRLEWALRPQGGMAAYLAWACKWKVTDGKSLPFVLIRPPLMADVFAILLQSFSGN